MQLKKYEKNFIKEKLEIIRGADYNLKELSDKMVFINDDSKKYYNQQLTDILSSVKDLLSFITNQP